MRLEGPARAYPAGDGESLRSVEQESEVTRALERSLWQLIWMMNWDGQTCVRNKLGNYWQSLGVKQGSKLRQQQRG